MTDQDCNLIIASGANTLPDLYCVYEHYMSFSADPTQAPELVYVGTCKLIDVYQMRDARNNSDWIALAANGYPLLVRVIHTTADRHAALSTAVRHVKSFLTMPRCNLHGYNMFGSNRTLIGSDGREFANQAEAARALGCSQSAISQHIKGSLSNIKGYKLTFKHGNGK